MESLKGFLILTVLERTVLGAILFHEGHCPEGRGQGEAWFEGCTRYECEENGYTLETCGRVAVPTGDGCHVVENHKADWPDCCPIIQCDKP